MADPNFDAQAVFTFAKQLALDAGSRILSGSSTLRSSLSSGDLSSILKKNTADLVTETDQATEELIKGRIEKEFGGKHGFIGEESWAKGEENVLGMEPTWIIDPVDGTTNFVHHFPFCCVSMALAHRRELVFGIVYAPFLDRMYTGLKGHGSYLITSASTSSADQQRLPLSKPLPLPSLKQALLALEWGSDRRADVVAKKARTMEKLCSEDGNMAQGIRSIGSAALSCCFVAEGAIDLYSEYGCWAWDVGAGFTIINEAGGLTVGGKKSTLELISSSSADLGVVTPEILQGRKYCVVRAVGDLTEESGLGKKTAKEQQCELLKDFYEAMDEWDVN